MAGSAVGDQTKDFLGDYHDKKILEVLVNNSVYYQLADKRPIAMRSGNVITFHTAAKLPNGSKLTEGVQPTAVFMTGGTKTATLVEFGQVTSIANVMSKTAIVDLMDQAITRLGESASTTLDVYIQNRLVSDSVTTDSTPQGTAAYENSLSSWYAGMMGGISTYMLSGVAQSLVGVATAAGWISTITTAFGAQDYGMTVNKIRRLVSILQANNVKPYDSDFVMVAHPNAIWQLKRDPDWKDWNVSQYAEKMFNGEIGKIEGVRFIQTTNQQKLKYQIAAGFSGYMNVLLGKQCFAISELQGDAGIRSYTLPFSHQDSGNVLQQNAFAGWRWLGVAKVIDPKQGINLLTFDVY